MSSNAPSTPSDKTPYSPQSMPPLLKRHRELSIATCIMLFIAFLLFLLDALSVPIIKTIYILALHANVEPGPATLVADEVQFGVWGYCAISQLPGTSPTCVGPALGYTILDQTILTALGSTYAPLATIASKALTVLLVLHPVVCGLSFIGAVTSLWITSHAVLILSLIITLTNALLSTVVFAADLALVLVAKNGTANQTQFSISITWGPVVWMTLTAVILSWIGMILLSIPVCGCCGVGDAYEEWEAAQYTKRQKMISGW